MPFEVAALLSLLACTASSSPNLDAGASSTTSPPSVVEIPPSDLSVEVVAKVGALAAPCPDAGTDERPGDRPCSSESRARVLAGEPLHVVVRLRHTGAVPGDLLERAAGLDYDLEVLGPDGTPRPLTLYGKHRLAQRATTAPVARSLGPGEVVETGLFLSRMVDVTHLGIYQLRVARTTPAGTTRSAVFQFDLVRH
jgi:hypothetical protein